MTHTQMEERLDREIEEEKAAAAAGIPWVQSPEGSKEGNATVTAAGEAEEEETGTLFNGKYLNAVTFEIGLGNLVFF